METTDVVIVGGGIIGCAIAYFLRKHQIDVTLLEREEIGSQASGAAAGLLAPLGPLSGPGPFADLVLAGFAQLSALVPELEDMSGLRLGYERTGALRVVRHPKRVAALQKRLERWRPLGLSLFWLTGEEARQREPLLAPDICAAVYAPEESQIHAPQVVHAFALAAQRAGARIASHQEVNQIVLDGTKVTGVCTVQGKRIACDRLVIASGAWSAQWGGWFQHPFPVTPLHGQMLSLTQTQSPLKYLIFGEAVYLAPRGTTILVGATKEERGFDQTVTEAGTSWLSATAERLIPSLAGQPLQSCWAGLRPQTPDHHPLLGRIPLWENAFIAAGHNSVGVILSAITGQCLTELLTTGRVPPLIRPFSVERFATQASLINSPEQAS